MTNREIKRSEAAALATKRFYLLIMMLVLILLFVVGAIVLWIVTPRQAEPGDTNAPFVVKTITVEGSTKYSEDAVIAASGVVLGESLFSVKGREVESRLLEAFPYFQTVDAQTLHMSEVHIVVTEETAVGAVFADDAWVLISEDAKALEKQAIKTNKPKRVMYVKGADAPEEGVQLGQTAMDTYCQTIFKTILTAIRRYDLQNVTEIDLSDKNDLCLTWNDRVLVRLGTAANLDYEIAVVAETIPELITSRGAQVSGVLNVASYSYDDLENQAVFTPSSLLPQSTTPTRRPAPGETALTTTTTAPSEESNDEQENWEEDDWSDSEDEE